MLFSSNSGLFLCIYAVSEGFIADQLNSCYILPLFIVQLIIPIIQLIYTNFELSPKILACTTH